MELPSGGAISLDLIDIKETLGVSDCVYNSGMSGLDWERLSGSLSLRNWGPGDQTYADSRRGEDQDAFPDRADSLMGGAGTGGQSDGWRRHVWARRFGPAARYAARPKSRYCSGRRDNGALSR